MLLSGVLLILFLDGCWLYCLVDAALTPAAEYRGLRKAAWIGIIAVTFIVGAIAWLVGRHRSRRTRAWVTGHAGRVTLATPGNAGFTWYQGAAADEAIARHPASRGRHVFLRGWTAARGPDDDPEFLRLLERQIRGTSADAGE